MARRRRSCSPSELVEPRRDDVKTYARLMFWGRYKTEHSVDVAYEVDGRPKVAAALAIEPGPDA